VRWCFISFIHPIPGEYQMGKFLLGMKKAKGARGNPGGQGAKIVRCIDGTTQTYADLGITKKQWVEVHLGPRLWWG